MQILNKTFLIVLLLIVSTVSCSKKNVRLIDADSYKGKMYVYIDQETHKTLFYMKYSTEGITITLVSQFGETIYAAGYSKKDDSFSVSSASIDLDKKSIHNAVRLLHSILLERVYAAPVQSEYGRVEFDDNDEDGFPRVWTITTSMFRAKVIFNEN